MQEKTGGKCRLLQEECCRSQPLGEPSTRGEAVQARKGKVCGQGSGKLKTTGEEDNGVSRQVQHIAGAHPGFDVTA